MDPGLSKYTFYVTADDSAGNYNPEKEEETVTTPTAADTTSVDYQRFFLQSGSTVAVELYTKSGKLLYKDAAGVEKPLTAAYTLNAWNTIRLIANPASDTYDIYLNGTLSKSATPYRNPVANLDTILFGSGGSSTGTMHVDDVIVSK